MNYVHTEICCSLKSLNAFEVRTLRATLVPILPLISMIILWDVGNRDVVLCAQGKLTPELAVNPVTLGQVTLSSKDLSAGTAAIAPNMTAASQVYFESQILYMWGLHKVPPHSPLFRPCSIGIGLKEKLRGFWLTWWPLFRCFESNYAGLNIKTQMFNLCIVRLYSGTKPSDVLRSKILLCHVGGCGWETLSRYIAKTKLGRCPFVICHHLSLYDY